MICGGGGRVVLTIISITHTPVAFRDAAAGELVAARFARSVAATSAARILRASRVFCNRRQQQQLKHTKESQPDNS